MKAYEAFEKVEAARELARKEMRSGRKEAYREAIKNLRRAEAELELIMEKRAA